MYIKKSQGLLKIINMEFVLNHQEEGQLVIIKNTNQYQEVEGLNRHKEKEN
jgi:hypothetical protein